MQDGTHVRVTDTGERATIDYSTTERGTGRKLYALSVEGGETDVVKPMAYAEQLELA